MQSNALAAPHIQQHAHGSARHAHQLHTRANISHCPHMSSPLVWIDQQQHMHAHHCHQQHALTRMSICSAHALAAHSGTRTNHTQWHASATHTSVIGTHALAEQNRVCGARAACRQIQRATLQRAGPLTRSRSNPHLRCSNAETCLVEPLKPNPAGCRAPVTPLPRSWLLQGAEPHLDPLCASLSCASCARSPSPCTWVNVPWDTTPGRMRVGCGTLFFFFFITSV